MSDADASFRDDERRRTSDLIPRPSDARQVIMMPLTAAQERLLHAELAYLEPLFAMTRGDDQERLLDHAFTLIGHDPEWAVWLHYARIYLVAYQRRDGEAADG